MLCPLLDEGDINPKVLQLIGSEKIQVRKSGAWLRQDSGWSLRPGPVFWGSRPGSTVYVPGCVWAARAPTCGALGADWAACLSSGAIPAQAGLEALGGSAGCSVTLIPWRTETRVARRDAPKAEASHAHRADHEAGGHSWVGHMREATN